MFFTSFNNLMLMMHGQVIKEGGQIKESHAQFTISPVFD